MEAATAILVDAIAMATLMYISPAHPNEDSPHFLHDVERLPEDIRGPTLTSTSSLARAEPHGKCGAHVWLWVVRTFQGVYTNVA
jgi:hypothetical protein